jgi:NAD(P)-dependent dehydrogenase (short-subunit alcohol dehydrogenase family)
MQEEIKAMEKQAPQTTPGVKSSTRAQRGAIINIASVTGLAAIQNIMPYTVSKHAVIGMTKSAAIDHGYQQIRINCVCPGMADTPLVKGRKALESSNKASTWSTDGNVLQRLAMPEEIADVCVFLSSCRASYMIGEAVVIDGGHMAALRYEPKIAEALVAR